MAAAAAVSVVLCPLFVAAPSANAARATEIDLVGTGGQGANLKGLLNNWTAKQYGVDAYVKDDYPASAYVLGLAGPTMDSSTDTADTNLRYLVATTDGRIVVVGLSQGAIGATKTLNNYLANPETAPSPDRVSFVLVGSPYRPGTGIAGQNPGFYNPLAGLTYGKTPENTPYHVDDVARQYDGFADGVYNVKDLPSLLAFFNSVAGIAVIHPYYNNVDPSDPSTLVKTVGNTTYYLIPTERLPLLAGVYAVSDGFGGKNGPLTQIVNQINTALKAEIEKAYDRSGYHPVGSQSDPASVPPVAEQTSTVTLSLSQKPADEKKPAPTPNPVSANQPTPGQTKQDETPKQDPPKVTNDDVKVNPSPTPEVTKADQQPSSDTPPAAEAPKPKQDPESPKVPATKKPKPTKDSKVSKDADDSDAASGPKGETPKASSDAGPKAKSNDADGAMKPKPKPVRVKPGSKDSDKGGASASPSSPSSAPKHETASHGAGGKKSSD